VYRKNTVTLTICSRGLHQCYVRRECRKSRSQDAQKKIPPAAFQGATETFAGSILSNVKPHLGPIDQNSFTPQKSSGESTSIMSKVQKPAGLLKEGEKGLYALAAEKIIYTSSKGMVRDS